MYGGLAAVQKALDAGKATWAWQTHSWSHDQWDQRAHIRQYPDAFPHAPDSKFHVSIGGVECDIDRAMTADFGQWGGEADMPLNDDDRKAIMKIVHSQLQHFGLFLMANRTGTVFNRTDLADFHMDEWKTIPELRDELFERQRLMLYRLLKGQNSVFNASNFPDDEPQPSIRDLQSALATAALATAQTAMLEAVRDLHPELTDAQLNAIADRAAERLSRLIGSTPHHD